MKHAVTALLFIVSLMFTGLAFADSYDAQWVAECVKDNMDAKVSVEVITRYCTCMTMKMDREETQSVTQWEKTHPQERRECDRQAGWK